MNDLDKILKEALDGYEAPFNPQMWDKVSSRLSPIEDTFRNSVDAYEAPYNPAAWSAIKNKIGPSNSLWKWITGSAAVIALTAVTVINIPPTETADDKQITNQNASNTEKTVVTNENLITQNTPDFSQKYWSRLHNIKIIILKKINLNPQYIIHFLIFYYQ